jgi:hypothetical protein
MLSHFASATMFILAVVVLGFALRAVTRRKASPQPTLTAEISPLRCGCDPKSEHPQFGARPIPCADDEADWWFASENQGNFCVWQKRFDSRDEAERTLVERGWKNAQFWAREQVPE